jgi:hypothetical protein
LGGRRTGKGVVVGQVGDDSSSLECVWNLCALRGQTRVFDGADELVDALMGFSAWRRMVVRSGKVVADAAMWLEGEGEGGRAGEERRKSQENRRRGVRTD